MHYERFELGNGLRVILVPMASVQSVTTLVFGNTGSRFETRDQWGVAHFFEHMVFKGTKRYPTPLKLATALDSVGASSNAFTGKEYTGYYVKSASRHLPLALDVLSDMMFAPLLKSADVEREKGVILEEINMYLDQPMHRVGNEFDKMFYAGSGLAHDILGTKDSVSRLNNQDLRQFLHQWYGPANLTLVIAGDATQVASQSVRQQVHRYFDLQVDRDNQRRPTKTMAGRESRFGQERLLVIPQTTEQAHLVMAWPGMGVADKRKNALNLLSVVMGGNMSSRLFVEVREKRGLGYYVRSEADFYHHVGAFGASVGVDPQRVNQAVEVIQDQFHQLVSGQRPVTASELKHAKEFLSGQLSLSLEDSRSVAQWFAMRDVLLDEIKTPTESLAEIQAVSLSEVNQLATELIQDGQMRLAVIGPLQASEFKQYV